eukprot:gnl/TRDRNA2_/TRDRNA2_43951_c0_seq1.p1 gnl/TRDRNA2_/TRDRNA2_43951_c0~~gnl/TRDRNA2_/TRDRNA2_43951_c0_seq1.p1  ORF type:complete len:429 (+),score=63.17 gnl/TRDRNA2_/TRDRNA2_43951_c0_seq1:1035-2321(+)
MSDKWGTVITAAWTLLPEVVDKDSVLLIRLITKLVSSDKVAHQSRGLQLADAFPQAVDSQTRDIISALASSPTADIRYQVLRMANPQLGRKRHIGLVSIDRYSQQDQACRPSESSLSLPLRLLNDKSELIRFAAIGTITRTAKMNPSALSCADAKNTKLGLRGRLKDTASDIRSRALQALHELGFVFDADVCPAVVSRTTDRCIDVAHWAARVLKLGVRDGCMCSACDNGSEGSGVDTDEFEECSNHNLKRHIDSDRIDLVPKHDPSWVWYVSKSGLDDVRKLMEEGKTIAAEKIKNDFVEPEDSDLCDDHQLVAVDMRACGVNQTGLAEILETLGPENAAIAFCRAADLFNASVGGASPPVPPELTIKELKEILAGDLSEVLLETGEEERPLVEDSEEEEAPSDGEHDMVSTHLGAEDVLRLAFSGL